MLPARLALLLAATASLGIAGCATVPGENRARLIDIPLASAHADIAFTISTGARGSAPCDEGVTCPGASAGEEANRFARQVQRLAGVLQKGARQLYPDLQQRAPGLSAGGFDVYVVDGNEQGSASSPNGRIALNSALGAQRPYDDWVAFVIAREMGHVIARHHEDNSMASMATSTLMNILIPGSGLLKMLLSAGGSAIAGKSQRGSQALEADAIARKLLEASGLRLRNVYLTLLIDPLVLDQGAWSNDFRRSSDNFITYVRKSEFTVATAR
jgi:hypothetical protein